jgi:MFS family permease
MGGAVDEGRGRRAVWAALVAMFVDGLDIAMPVFVLAPAQGYFLPPSTPPGDLALFAGLTYAATLIARPLGAVIFGVVADLAGRKRTTVLVTAAFGVATLLFVLLPGYARIGFLAPALFLALRFVDGIFLGGEYTAANPLAMEYAPKEKRGLYGAIIQLAPAASQATLSIVTLGLLLVIPAGSPTSPYVQWGWRIPFVVGGLLALGLAVYYHRSVAESELWTRAARTTFPLKELFTGDNLPNFIQVFILMTGVWFAIFPMVGSMPGLLAQLGLSSRQVTLTLAIGTAAAALWYIPAGALSQRIGRRAYFVIMGLADMLIASVALALLLGSAHRALGAIVLLVLVIQVACQGSAALNTVYICERFRTSIRSSGFGLGYSLAIVIPSLYAVYQVGLRHLMPVALTVVLFPVLGGLLMLIGTALSPETKDVDMAGEPEKTTAGPAS